MREREEGRVYFCEYCLQDYYSKCWKTPSSFWKRKVIRSHFKIYFNTVFKMRVTIWRNYFTISYHADILSELSTCMKGNTQTPPVLFLRVGREKYATPAASHPSFHLIRGWMDLETGKIQVQDIRLTKRLRHSHVTVEHVSYSIPPLPSSWHISSPKMLQIILKWKSTPWGIGVSIIITFSIARILELSDYCIFL